MRPFKQHRSTRTKITPFAGKKWSAPDHMPPSYPVWHEQPMPRIDSLPREQKLAIAATMPLDIKSFLGQTRAVFGDHQRVGYMKGKA